MRRLRIALRRHRWRDSLSMRSLRCEWHLTLLTERWQVTVGKLLGRYL